MSPVKHAVICAAGIGSRLGLNKPKCLVEVAGRTLLDWHLERLQWAETVWLVVGYQEDDVIAHAISLRPDLIVVRNPDYARTNTLQSIYRVSRHLDERMLVLDADTVMDARSFESFLQASQTHEQLIGVSPYITSDGVRVQLDASGSQVLGFTREPHYAMEWTGIAVIKPQLVINQPIFVYQALEACLPLPAFELKAFDIDTTADLDMARKVFATQWGEHE
ncbi:MULTISPECIES: phosphocholine cytidylyltransferase family protein [Pseudomonas]|jgi:choline kinase|uniref:NTP transferase domain-containing protein n=1 Tax=Pseudomonas promysalinigenes TaxID=485898 RepID=A0ABY6AI63_9PSED|nr:MULTISPECIES: NTP transferase domain-containing protein [Pseudomonas]UXH38645.1 NTP transferase domain-containing protein [Pseudomonas promysalinigenes]